MSKKLNTSDTEFVKSFFPTFAQAISRAENDPTGQHGVRSIKTTNPTQVLNTSIRKNFNRWNTGKRPAPWINERPKKFIDFMQRRWAPIGAENDPENLNKNWAPNVRSILKQMMDAEEYKKLQDLNLVKNPLVGRNAWT